jgi:acetyltransferase-like isoleucine patch superfamily enzyme
LIKSTVKAVGRAIAAWLACPLASAYCLAAAAFGSSQAFPGWSQALSLLPGLTGVYLRRAFYRWVLPRCESGTVISFGTVFSHPTAEIGENAYLGVFCCLGDVTIEDDALIGSHVSITNGSRQHGIDRLDIPVREQPGQWPRITIGRDTWIGDRAIVMADVGRHCVVGAGAVVTRPVPDYAIVVGSPARIIGYRGPATDDHRLETPPSRVADGEKSLAAGCESLSRLRRTALYQPLS